MQSGRSIRGAAALLAVAATLLAASSAQAAASWHNGVAVTSSLFNPCLGISEFGAMAQAGYLTDVATTHPGDVFYAHALFGAATHVGGNCTDRDQFGELDVILPPGVALAIDGKHPVYCFFEDTGGTEQRDPTCPTHAVNGAYGPSFPHGDGGGPWDMPPGRTLEVQFPVRTSRALRGPAGGHCPQDLGDLAIDHQRDCLLVALHVADGTGDPWLLPNVDMVVAPGAARPTLSAVRHVRARARRVTVTLALPRAGATARVTVRQGKRTLGRLTRRHLRKGKVRLHMRLSRKARPGRITVIAKVSRPKATLRTSVTVSR
jgi:hypothetical protein